jgi:hypothetical protein
MKKIILIIGLLVLLLFSFGCIRKSSTGPEVIVYHTGTKGLEINLLKNLPPDEIWKGNAFVIGVELINSGAYDIEEGKLTINYDTKYTEIIEPQRTFELKGKQQGYPDGERILMNFDARNLKVPGERDEGLGSFTVLSQYHYGTTASTEVCINPDVYNIIKTNEICEIKTIDLRQGQGAPVTITKIEQTISPRNLDYVVSFLFHIQNKGKGGVLNKKIKITEAKLSNQKLQCLEELPFDNKKENLLECSIVLKGLRGAYLAPLTIKLDYDYQESIDKKLTIVDLLLKAKKI